jgi:hypothetical protein
MEIAARCAEERFVYSFIHGSWNVMKIRTIVTCVIVYRMYVPYLVESLYIW